MKKLSFLLSVMVIAGSCTMHDDDLMVEGGTSYLAKSFKAHVENVTSDDTKAHLEELRVLFDDEDQITLFDMNTAASIYTYSAETEEFGGSSLTTGDELDAIYALYPHSNSVRWNDGMVEGTLPAVQQYEQNSFSKNSHIMFAVDDNLEDGLKFQNMGGYIELHLYGDDVTVTTIELQTLQEGQYVAGDFWIDPSTTTLTIYEDDAHTNKTSTVTLNCSEGEGDGVLLGDQDNPTIFYIALPAQNYSAGFMIKVTDIFGREFVRKASSPFELQRNYIKPMAALEVDVDSYLHIEKDPEDNHYYIPLHSVEDFLRWGYIAHNINHSLGIELEGHVLMPPFEIEADHANHTYVLTDTPITLDAEGVPSGSNWVPIGEVISSSTFDKSYHGVINGNGFSIKGLYINSSLANGTGLISTMYSGSVKDLTIKDSAIKGIDYTAALLGYCRYGVTIENVALENTHVFGQENVGGISGRTYRRTITGDESLCYIIDCSTDEFSSIHGTSSYVGGICGHNYGGAIIHSINNADVTGSNRAGGVVGSTRSYYNNGVSGYVIACGSTEKANIVATNSDGAAGGVAGSNFLDGNHFKAGSDSYIVACYSLSTLEGYYKGSIIGTSDTGIAMSVIGTWGKNYDNYKLNGRYTDRITPIASDQYSDASEITPEIVEEMNLAIDEYNNSVMDVTPSQNDSVKSNYYWQYNKGQWPTLVKRAE